MFENDNKSDNEPIENHVRVLDANFAPLKPETKLVGAETFRFVVVKN